MGRTFSARTYFYIILALALLITSWLANQNSAAAANRTIPEQSIRLRILANSDTVQDQQIKRQVRDAIVEQMNRWVVEPQGIDQARSEVLVKMPQLYELTGKVLRQAGFNYSYQVQLGEVPFPTKMYGTEVYPAGNYEALLVTLGAGKGQNWWCVLFPPLCFVNSISGEAIATRRAAHPSGKYAANDSATNSDSTSIDPKPEIHFFIWDFLQQLLDWIKAIF